MIVVSDTSPLTALLTVGETSILTNLFGEVVIPEAVRNELLRSLKAPESRDRIGSVRARWYPWPT